MQRGVQKPAEPDALAAARGADPVHAVVPVAGAEQRQAVRADGQARIQRAHAMLIQARRAESPRARRISSWLSARKRAAREERHVLIEHARNPR